MRDRSPFSPEVHALLDRERAIPAIPAMQRARALSRARAALATPATPVSAPTVVTAPPWRWAVAAAAGLAASAAIAAAAYEFHARRNRVTSAPPPALALAPAPIAAPLDPAPAPAPAPAQDAELAPDLALASPERTSTRSDLVRAELRLLQRARAAVVRGDFEAALQVIAEHTRRFKNGRLAEEREALRVKSLAGLGRTEAARRAAAAFRSHYPRSVLLPAVSRMPAATP